MNEIQKPFTNVDESWVLYDTLALCSQFYGAESIQQGWFNTFAAFADKETHSFYKQRTEGNIGLPYCNKASADTMDFAFEAYSFGVKFTAPSSRYQVELAEGRLKTVDSISAHWWEVELPRHCAIQLKVQQDIVAELPCMAAPCGYGAFGAGASAEHENTVHSHEIVNGTTIPAHPNFEPVLSYNATQGMPELSNRWRFPRKIGIPRTSTIEAILHVSDYARGIMALWNGPFSYALPTIVGEPPEDEVTLTAFPGRYTIQVTLIGKREVQQRGQYHV